MRTHIEEKGWKIDSKAMQPYLDEKVFTVASPGRRSNPHLRWALDPVPLVPPLGKPLNVVPDVEDKQA